MAAPEPEIQRHRAGVGREVAQRRDVARREVLHVQVVAHAGAVGRRPVGAVDREIRELAGGDPAQQRHEIVGPAGRRLADQCRTDARRPD